MKNQITSKILKFTFAFMFVLLASSCSDDNDAMDATAELNAKTNSDQILAGRPPVSTIVESFSWDGTGTVCAGESKDFCFTAAIGTNLQVQQETSQGSGVWVQVYQISQSTANPQCFQRTFAGGNYNLRYKIGSGGFTVVPVTVVNCSEGCNESFSYVSNGGGSYTFTYIPAEDMTDAELIFTFAQGTYVSGLDTWTDAGVTKHKVINLTACTLYSWTVVLQSNCKSIGKGQGQKKANVWTDFKVLPSDFNAEVDSEDNYSKKNDDTPTIEMSCSN